MLNRLPAYQTPTWFVALLIALGAAFEVQHNYHKTSQHGRANLRETLNPRDANHEIVDSTPPDHMFADQ